MKQFAAVDDTVYFWFAANDTSGSGGDGASPAADVRLAGAAADAAPVYSPTPALLSHASYPAGAYEIAIAATAANGFAANNTYAIFCTLAIDAQNPTGFVGSFDLKPIEANIIQIGDAAQSATDLKDFADTGYDPSAHRTQAQVKAIDSGAITATSIAADAIGASEFAQGAADKVRASVCVTGDPANSIGKILYEIYINRLTSARAGYLANINNANLATIADISTLTATEIAYLNASISSRSSHTATNVWAVGTRALTDKAGFSLAAAGITAIWEKNISAFSGAGYAGTYVKTLYDDWINGGRLDNLLDAVYTGTPPTVGAIADQVWDEILTAATHNVATSAGRRLRQAEDVMIVREETCQAGGGNSEIILDSGASAVNDFYINDLVILTSGTGVGQQRHIDSYVGATKTATVNRAWTTNPDATTTYSIKADSSKHVHGFETAAKAEIESEVNDALVALKLDHLIAIADGDDPVNNSLIAMLAATDGDWSNFAKGTDALQAIRDRGDSAWITGGGGTAAEIADAVWDELQSGHTDAGSFGKYLDTEVTSVGGVGSGALSCTWTQKDEGGTAMDNVQVWISTDEAGNNVVAGTLLTDSSGEATFMLDAGTYYVWRERAGYNFTNPQTWAVS